MKYSIGTVIVGGVVIALLAGTLLLTKCNRASSSSSLNKPIGIITEGDVITEIIPAGQAIPHTYSDTFSNAEDSQQAIEIALAQKGESGVEKICVVVIDDLPPRPAGTLYVIITAKVDQEKNLRVKATVSESGYIKKFGPFPVE